MKKIIAAFFCIFVSSIFLCLPFYAQEVPAFVTDSAGILSDDEVDTLNYIADSISRKHNLGVYILTVDDFTNYSTSDDVEIALEDIYLENGLGLGDDYSGIILMLSMQERNFGIYAYGYGNTAFTDYGKEYLSELFLDDFRNNDWYTGFSDYLSACDDMIEASVNGVPVDVDTIPVSFGYKIAGVVICVILGFITAFVVTGILKSQLKSVAHGTYADAFVTSEGLQLTEHSDYYMHTTRTRTYSPVQNSSSGSGGTSISSRGGSSYSGKF